MMRGSKGFIHRFVTAASVALALVFAQSPAAQAQTSYQEIVGLPLKIMAYDTGEMAAYVHDGTNYVYQYYSEDSWGSVVMFDAEGVTQKYSDGYHDSYGATIFTPVSNSMPTAAEIDTVMDAGVSGVRITQKVEYANGSPYYKMTWSIANIGSTTYTNVKFFHGGDAYFGGNDSAQSYWDPNLGMVYLRNPGLSGLMGLYGGVGSSADHYFGGPYSTGNQQAVDGQLQDTVDETFLDAGYHLQWNRATLAPGQTWVITAYEKWTEAGDVQVLAPADQAAPGGTADLEFTVQNFQNAEDTFDLAVLSDLGWAVSLPDGISITLAAGTSTSVIARVTVPANSEGQVDTISLTATSQANATITNSDSAQLTSQASADPTPVDPATASGHNGSSNGWCFISATQGASSVSGAMIVLGAVICLGVCRLNRRA
jgi:hypothetical protein